jgi:Lrp/AsnC family leucine-responsive transcriptional regulator
MNGGMDAIDVGILAMLQENGRVSQHDLAKAVGLSAPAVSDRLKKLEERGVIRGYTALLDPRALGQDVTAFIAVGINGSKHYVGFRQRARDRSEVMECHSVTGEGSHLLKVRVASTVALESLLAEIQSWPGVQWTTTSLVLSTVKETIGVALPEPARVSGAPDEDERGPSELLMVPFRHKT